MQSYEYSFEVIDIPLKYLQKRERIFSSSATTAVLTDK